MKSSQYRKPLCIEPEEADKAHGFNLAHKSFKKLVTQCPLSSEVLCVPVPPAPFIGKLTGPRWQVMQTGGAQKEKGMGKTKNSYSPGTRWAYLASSTTPCREMRDTINTCPSPRSSRGVSLSLVQKRKWKLRVEITSVRFYSCDWE